MHRSKAAILAVLRQELHAMRGERLAAPAATKAERHAEALARARAKDEARAKRNADVPHA